MQLPLWITILLAATDGVSSLSARTDATDICLPSALQSAVPSCAISCLQIFILNNYHSDECALTANLELLCTTQTKSGLTLGEGSLQCVISNCAGAEIETRSGYTVCDGVPGALPNMAETITATVDSISTLMSSAESTTPTAGILTEATSTESLLTSAPSAPAGPSTPTPPTPPTPPTLTETPILQSFSAPGSSTSTSVLESQTSTTSSASANSANQTPSSVSSGVRTTLSVSSTRTTATTTASSSAAAATQSSQKETLSTSAIAGIATAVVIVLALAAGYLAYLWIVRKKEKSKRRSQSFTMILPGGPEAGDDDVGSAPPPVAENSQLSSTQSLNRRYYAGEPVQEKRRSFWRRSVMPPPSDIGVAVAPSARVSPERRSAAFKTANNKLSWPSAAAAPRTQENTGAESRWSIATSFDEDIEAQNQDVPILGSQKAHSSARSLSSSGIVEKPAPLRLSKLKPRAETPPSAKMPLTPIYDNGNFELTIRQVLEDPFVEGPSLLNSRAAPEPSAMNFSRRQPSLTRASQDQPGPFATQMRQSNPMGRFSMKAARKPSEISTQSVSVYTEIEEDDTPEQEEDKQLGQTPTPVPAPAAAALRSPLRDLQWPQVPRPAALARQADKPHSPRVAVGVGVGIGPVIRRIDPPPPGDSQLQRPGPRTFLRTNSSSTSIPTTSTSTTSSSPVFPIPPSRVHRRTNAQSDLTLQITNAHKAASRATTATTTPTKPQPSRSYIAVGGSDENHSVQPLGDMYRRIQRLSSLAQGPRPRREMSVRKGIGREQEQKLTRSVSRAKITPMTSRSGDLYLSVGEMEG